MTRRAPIRVYVYALVVALYVAIATPAPTLPLGLLAFVANYFVAFWVAWAICYACDLFAGRGR
jgi:hypothetical protein